MVSRRRRRREIKIGHDLKCLSRKKNIV